MKTAIKSRINIINPTAISFSEVVSIFKQENGLNLSSENNRTLFLLELANVFFGNWVHGKLSPNQIHKIILPYHKHSDFELIPESGLSLKKSINRYLSIKREYKKRNFECYNIISKYINANIDTIYLSHGAIIDQNNYEINSFKEYRKINIAEPSLVHLDGLHRLLAWELSSVKQKLPVIVACKNLKDFSDSLRASI